MTSNSSKRDPIFPLLGSASSFCNVIYNDWMLPHLKWVCVHASTSYGKLRVNVNHLRTMSCHVKGKKHWQGGLCIGTLRLHYVLKTLKRKSKIFDWHDDTVIPLLKISLDFVLHIGQDIHFHHPCTLPPSPPMITTTWLSIYIVLQLYILLAFRKYSTGLRKTSKTTFCLKSPARIACRRTRTRCSQAGESNTLGSQPATLQEALLAFVTSKRADFLACVLKLLTEMWKKQRMELDPTLLIFYFILFHLFFLVEFINRHRT